MGLDYSITRKNPDLATSGKAAAALGAELLLKAEYFDDPEHWRKQIRAELEVVSAHISSAITRAEEPMSKAELFAINARGVELFQQLAWIQAKMYLTYYNEHGRSWDGAAAVRTARSA